MGYEIATESGSGDDARQVGTESRFGRDLGRLFARIRPQRIIETGTHLGTGTTAIIGSALRRIGLTATFYSIEVNPEFAARAAQNIKQQRFDVRLLNGLSVPRHLLPTRERIRALYVEGDEQGVFVDHAPAERVDAYFSETDFPDLPDDLLGKCLTEFNDRPDFVLLDSAGHMGFIEFGHVASRLKGHCYLALDDTRHVKHHRSVGAMRCDPRFNVLISSPEKFGYCIAEFNPGFARAAHGDWKHRLRRWLGR